MSESDRRLIGVSGNSFAHVAKLLGKARQTIARGVNGEDDYFSLPDIIELIKSLEQRNAYAAEGLTHAACRFYPTLSDSIIAGLKKDSNAELGNPGLYRFICADFSLFQSKFGSCLSQLISLKDGKDVWLECFIQPNEYRAAMRVLEYPGPSNNVQVIPCSKDALRAMPFMIIYKDMSNNHSLFTATHSAFSRQPSEEAIRLSDFVIDNFLVEDAFIGA